MGLPEWTREQSEMRTIRLLTSGMRQQQVSEMRSGKATSQAVEWGEVEAQLTSLSPVHHLQTFCNRLIGSINVACTYRDDMDKKRLSVMELHSKDRHSKIDAEELAQKWNVGLETAKDTLNVTTQHVVWTATQPMSRRVRPDLYD